MNGELFYQGLTIFERFFPKAELILIIKRAKYISFDQCNEYVVIIMIIIISATHYYLFDRNGECIVCLKCAYIPIVGYLLL